MKRTEMKNVQIKKKTGYNIYGLKNRTFYILAALVCAVMIDAVIQIPIQSFPLPVKIVLDILVIAAALGLALFKSTSDNSRVVPYLRQEGFEFLGLYDLSGKESLNSTDILSREEEVRYLNQMLETLIFQQNSVKQAICLTGKSGCGKSTILSFFKREYKDRYQIYDFSGNYTNLKTALTQRFGNNLDQELLAQAGKQKLVFIFDQFERFFFLEESRKEEVRELLSSLSKKNMAMILSMREEYLADFMKEFDINNMKQGARDNDSKDQTGILNGLTSMIRDDRKNYHVLNTSQFSRTVTWQQELIKENYHVHLEHPGTRSEHTALDPVGNTIYYCENQNEVKVRCNGTEENATVLQNKCELLFGAAGRDFYEKHRQEPLIQQQISYHMAEYEKKVKEQSEDALKEVFAMEDYELLNHYFDVQLTAAGDYFNASRILYLLSQARLNHVVMKRRDLEFGLFENQFSKDGHKAVNRMIEKMEELQLIRRNIERSDQEYEIAHDFVAQAFLNYSHSNMDRNVKSALDIYMAEYLDTNKKNYIEEKRNHCRKVQKSKYYTVIYIVFALLAAAVDGMIHFAWNPWQNIWQEINVYGGIFTFVPLLMTEACMLYIYNVYQKVVQFYRGRKESLCKVIFAVIMVAAVFATFCYPHGLLFYGLGLALMGGNCALLLNDSYQKASRMEMRNYGLKCVMMGLAFAVLHLILWIFNQRFPVYIIFVEMVMMLLLVAYAYLAHMTKEYLYGRRMDAGSDRGET
ncbi:Uncharacterised protein [uncultured Roseburia sp.]|uniref:ATP-binding protein n=1 Tax=Brotonthovivens ammoniilytica TaxID=2981725 RepID=A0ABT2TM99_9FIRM|nr:ATP-binding protein [Brotonthovivens ammoniilytica]MCU6763344.1 ATP-binding protein [Brotonthovivens ammoniilytica]SCJ14268.1 Uncharacterised protein [uncultured Roseburia sp.]